MLIPVFLCLAPPLVVALHGLGVPIPAAIVLTLLLGGTAAWGAALALWIGLEEGRNAALAAALVWAYPQTWFAFQTGNFQITAIPLAVLGLAFATSRPLPGAALTTATYGPDLLVQFLRDEVPQLADGSAFPMTEKPRSIPVNFSIYGLTVKLRSLGVDALDVAAGKRIAQVYALLLVTLVTWAGWVSRGVGPPPPRFDASLGSSSRSSSRDTCS